MNYQRIYDQLIEDRRVNPPAEYVEVGKKCGCCQLTKALDCFAKNKSTNDGRARRCRDCVKAKRLDKISKETPEEYAARRERERSIVDKWRRSSPERVTELDRIYKDKNRDEINAKQRVRAANRDRDEKRSYARLWKELNPEKHAASQRRRMARHRSKPQVKVHRAVSAVIRVALAGGKSGRKTFDLLGYTAEELKAHIERQFLHGMSWGNYGHASGCWHIDHILPRVMFDYETPEDPDFKQCWAMTNLRPLWADENWIKGGKRLHLI